MCDRCVLWMLRSALKTFTSFAHAFSRQLYVRRCCRTAAGYDAPEIHEATTHKRASLMLAYTKYT